MRRISILAIAALAAPAAALAAPVPGLDLPLALNLAQAALADCHRRGFETSVSVVDADGLPLVVLRAPGDPKPPVAAPRKAATAALFDAPGSVLEPRQQSDPAFAARIAAEPERLNPHAGSLPLHAGGKLVGGLAIADAPHADADLCVRAALARFEGRLN